MKKSKTSYKKEPITFSEIGDVRYLHFGTPWVQGAMNLRKPFKLELEYARMMMMYILFLDEPAQVAQLGMGCASLTKFIWKNMPRTNSTVVELNPDVVNAAYTMFKLPSDEARINVVEADAAEWVEQQAAVFDVLQVDLYDASARGPVCDSVAFYSGCFNALKDNGMLTVNLFGDHPSFERNMTHLNQVFDGRVIAMPEIHEGNRIALAFKGAPLAVTWTDLYARASVVKEAYDLPAKRWVSALKQVALEAASHQGSTKEQFCV
ncbi:spermidine synthase [Hydromonas duriensis]|uniref:Spermidine synthase n=1 Tax=Hydromonas duriensis TaxID=1527608 RepID=A0A4V3DKA0_9BURK|nr:spermidine synthase [Hydromonas duriensis]TDR33150.1 spermidine synthase [Hydromonas duriensis]